MILKKSDRTSRLDEMSKDSLEAAANYSLKLSDYMGKKKVGIKVVAKSDKIQSEDEVVKECKDYLKKNGWDPRTIYTGGIPIGFGKLAANPAKGIPDCIAFNKKTGKMIWIEYKKSKGGIISDEQNEWHKLLRIAGHTVHIINSLKLLKEVLEIES